jgi:hypothetical protein
MAHLSGGEKMTVKIVDRKIVTEDSVKKLQLTVEYDYGLTKSFKWPVSGLTVAKIRADVKADYAQNQPESALEEATRPGYELNLE